MQPEPKIQMTLQVTPTAQRRARATRSGIHYKDQTQKRNESELEAALLPYRPMVPMSGPIALRAVANLPCPASRRREMTRNGVRPHVAKPDADNLLKQLLDALTRAGFWEDDRQVVSLALEKRYVLDETGSWVVTVDTACA